MSQKILIEIIGTEGLLDLPEQEYAIRNLEDTSQRVKEIVLGEGKKHKNYGWSIISATRENTK